MDDVDNLIVNEKKPRDRLPWWLLLRFCVVGQRYMTITR